MKQRPTQLTKLGLLAVCGIALGLVSCAPNEPESDSPDSSNANEAAQDPTDSIGASNRPPQEEEDSAPPEEDPLNPQVAQPDNDNDEGETDENGNQKPDMDKLIELSLNNADINNVTQWLAENAQKSVVKDPNVNCRLTIVNPNKIKLSEALDLIYSALQLEGYLAIERGDVLFIVPKDKAGSIRADVASEDTAGDSRRRIVKVYDLEYAEADELEDRIANIVSENAEIEAHDFANKLVVTDYGDRIAILDQVIESLDVERSGEFDIRVIRIKNVDAEDLADEIEPIYERWDREINEDVEVVANQRSNSLIVLSNKTTFDMIESLVQTLDVTDAQQTIMDTFVLKNADAEEVAQQLTDLFENDSNSRNRYSYYRSRNDDEVTVNFVANRRQNSIIVQCPPGTLSQVEDLIEQLDARITDASLAPRIFRLKYVSAYDIELVLDEIFAQEEETRDYFGFGSFYNNDRGGSSGAGRLAGKVNITSEAYSNSVIVTSNSAENLEAVHQVIKQLDVPSSAGETTLRVPLNFAEATNVATQLNILFATAGAPPMQQQNNQGNNQNNQQGGQQGGQQGNQFRQGFVLERDQEDRGYYPWLGGQAQQGGGFGGFGGGGSTTTTRPVSDLVGRVRVVPDNRTNSLLVTSNMNYFPEVMNLVNDLDLPTPQVVIQAKIVEVNTDLRDRIGVRWSPNGDQVFEQDDFDTSILGSGSGDYRDVITGSELANALTTGVLSANVNLDVLIQFLKKTADAKILATPQINVEDNELGRLFVGAQVPFITQSTFVTQSGGRNDSFDYRDVGIILEVTPKINTESNVALSVRVESSSIREGETLFGGFIFDTRNFQTDLTANNDETLVLGGILQSEDRVIQRKVPLLGDIPGVGWAFKKRDTVTRDVELMVFLKPRVTRGPDDVRRLMEELQYESPNVTRWTRDLEERQRLSSEFSEEWHDLAPVEEPDSLLPDSKDSEDSESDEAPESPPPSDATESPKTSETPTAEDAEERESAVDTNEMESANPIPVQKQSSDWNNGQDTEIQDKLRRALDSQGKETQEGLPVVETPDSKDAAG